MASREAELALSVPKKKKSRGKAKVREVHIRKAHKGGFIVRHDLEHEDGSPAPTQEHVVPDTEALHDHIEEALGQAAPNDGQQGDQQPQPEGESDGEQG